MSSFLGPWSLIAAIPNNVYYIQHLAPKRVKQNQFKKS